MPCHLAGGVLVQAGAGAPARQQCRRCQAGLQQEHAQLPQHGRLDDLPAVHQAGAISLVQFRGAWIDVSITDILVPVFLLHSHWLLAPLAFPKGSRILLTKSDAISYLHPHTCNSGDACQVLLSWQVRCVADKPAERGGWASRDKESLRVHSGQDWRRHCLRASLAGVHRIP